jgi:hypothetical protein
MEFSRNKRGINAMKISSVKPLVGHANPREIPEAKARDR